MPGTVLRMGIVEVNDRVLGWEPGRAKKYLMRRNHVVVENEVLESVVNVHDGDRMRSCMS